MNLWKISSRRLVAVLVLLCAGSGLAMWLMQHEPIARYPLPDGTELRLEYVTYGTEHRVRGSGRFKVWITGLAQRWPGLGVPFHVGEYRYSSEEPQLGVWLTHFDPRTGKYLPAVEGALRVRSMYGTTDPIVSSLSYPFVYKDVQPMPHAAFQLSVYDRRKETVPLRVTMQNQTFELRIPNPAAKIAFPRWQPETLPQTRRVGDLDVVLREFLFVTSQKDRWASGQPITQPYVEFEVLQQGKKSKGIRVLPGLNFTDATGNRADGGHPPPFTEAAWKMRVQVSRTSDYPFVPTEGLLIGPALMPTAGRIAFLKVPAAEEEQGFRMAALVGPGSYIWKDGVLEATTEAVFESITAGTEWADGKTIKTAEPLLWLSFVDRTQEQSIARTMVATRMQWGGRSYGLMREQTSFPWPAGWSQFPRTSSYELGDEKNPAPPPGTPVTIQLVPVRMETVDFMVAPPKMPAAMAEKEK
jgi:hypothetical protein